MKKPYPFEKSSKAKDAKKDADKGSKPKKGKMPFFAKGGMAKGKRGC